MAYSDEDYISGVQNGDEVVFTALVREYVEPLTRFAYGFSGVEESSHDIVQDVFARIWELRDNWDPRSNVAAYLFTAVRNRALNVIKSSQADGRMRAALLTYKQETTDADPYGDIVLSSVIKREFENLTPRQQEALRLRYEQGLTIPQVAEIMGIETRPVARLIVRALDALRDALKHIED